MLLPELRREVWLCNLELPKNDLVKMTSGNVSGRDPATGLVVIKPSGLAYGDLTAENMVVLDLDGQVIEGELLPSVDTVTHLYVYKHRDDINGVVHTHSTYACVFATLNKPIPATLTTCGLVGGHVPLGGYYPPLGDSKIGEEMLRVMGNSLGVVMKNHGVFAIGKTASVATRVAVEVEDMAKVSYLAMLKGEPTILTDEQIEVMVQQYREGYGQNRKTNRTIVKSSS
jgi:L-ribulose-5-phosphate 4-epimerase